MPGIVEQVHSLAAAAAGALPCASELVLLADAAETELLTALSGLRRRVDAAISLLAADIERRSARELGAASLARQAGVRSGAELVQRLTGSSLGDAKKAVRVGVLLETAQTLAPIDETDAEAGPRSMEALAALPGGWEAPIAVAVRNGWLSAEQGDRLRSGLGAPPDAESAAAWRGACLRLIADCWEGELTVEDLGRAAKAVRACLDRDWARESSARLYEQRSLKRTVRADGMVKYDLLLDPFTDAQVWAPIFRSLAPRLGGPRFLSEDERRVTTELEPDARSNEQLLADTLTGFLAAGAAGSPALARCAPIVNVTVTAKELKKAIACPADGVGWLDGKPEPLTGPALVAALCDGALAGVLLDDSGRALDASKAERTFSSRQRRAMAVRDGGCLMPGCTMPPAACEAHHCNPWSERPENRRSETRDGVLLCRFHHLNLHNQGARVERRGSSHWLHWPGRPPLRLAPKHAIVAQLRTEGALS